MICYKSSILTIYCPTLLCVHCSDQMPLLHCGECRDNGDDDHRHNGFQKQSQRNSNEKHQTCRFVGDGVQKNAFPVHHQCGYLVDEFDENNSCSPNPKPFWECQDRDQLYAAAGHKRQICQTVQQCSCFAFAVELPCQETICHIAQSAGEIYYPKSDTSHIGKDETESAKEPEGSYEVWEMFHLTMKFIAENIR